MRAIFVALIVLGSLAAACAGDEDDGSAGTATPDDVLHLRGYDITLENFRLAIQGFFVGQDSTFCESIRGLTPAEAIDALDQKLLALPTNLPIPNATPVSPEAQRSREDEERAAQIALDECAGVSPSASRQGAFLLA